MVAIIGVHSENAVDEEKLNELREQYGNQPATFDEVEQAIALMTRSLMRDAVVGEQIQGVFNQSVLEVLHGKGIITETDVQNVADIMANATHQIYKELDETSTLQEEK